MKKKQTLTGILIMILAIALDQLTKQWAVAALKGKESLVLIKGVLEFSYLENTGAAFGSFRGLQIPLILVTLVIIVLWFINWLHYRITKGFIRSGSVVFF